MGDFIFGFIIGRVAITLFKWYFKLLRILFRTAWWLVVLMLVGLGAGVAWLVRGGHGRETFGGGGYGEFQQGNTLWKDRGSGTVYPVSPDQWEHCEIYAEEAGMNWQRTALSRIVRQGAICRYRLVALTDPAGDGTRKRAGWFEFLNEARKNIGLDELNPANADAPELAGPWQQAVQHNRDEVTGALEVLGAHLTNCGWELVDEPPSPSNQHWYASRYRRHVIDWGSPIPADPPAVTAADDPVGTT